MPTQQNPHIAGIDAVMAEKGYSNKEPFIVGVGGQTEFNLPKSIGGDVTVFEDGTITLKGVLVSGDKQVTTDPIPEGTKVEIIY